MAVDGTWKLTIDTPMGQQESTLTLAADGATLNGIQNAASGEGRPILDGTVNGDTVSWKSKIERPMPMTLEFTGAVSGNTISGQVKLGMFGSSTFTGTRA